MTPLPLSHRHTGTGDGSITTATHIMTLPSNHRTHHFLAITLNEEKLYSLAIHTIVATTMSYFL